jgi:hypothetical protein
LLTDCFGIGEMDLGIGCRWFCSAGSSAGAVEGAALGIDIDGGIDGRYLGLGQIFVLLEIALVIGLNVAARRSDTH